MTRYRAILNPLEISLDNISNDKNNKKVVDAFLFYNELEMLDLRFKELYDFVDYFVIVESPYTFTSKPKELFFKENYERYSKYLDKVKHVVVQDLTSKDPWVNEYRQREGLHQGISSLGLRDDDIIFISDVDEILDVDFIEKIKNFDFKNQAYHLRQIMYYYNLQCQLKDFWHLAKVCNYYYYKTYNSPSTIRQQRCNILLNAGWHFSYFGDAEFIKNKINNFSHQEFNKDEFTDVEKIKTRVTNGKDLFDRGDEVKILLVNPDETTYLPKNKEMLKTLSNGKWSL